MMDSRITLPVIRANNHRWLTKLCHNANKLTSSSLGVGPTGDTMFDFISVFMAFGGTYSNGELHCQRWLPGRHACFDHIHCGVEDGVIAINRVGNIVAEPMSEQP